jgi:predicted GNAT superfamily acetyltransferase
MTAPDELASVEYGTDLRGPLSGTRPSADTAVETADLAARAAGVRIREVADLADLDAVYRLYDTIWRPDPTNPPVTTELLRALAKAGNYVTGAFQGTRLVGACVGFFRPPGDEAMHSHIAGVSAAATGRSVGFALKTHQRAWAMLRGVSEIAWTFDPLVCRNAYFNLVKLAATPTEYLPNFYGGMHDGINGGDDTDRLLVRWALDTPEVTAACAGTFRACDAEAERAGGAVVALTRSNDGRPVAGELVGETLLVAVPPDVESLRAAEPECGREWRGALRDVLTTLLADGAHIAGFDRSGWYVVRRGGEDRG